MSNPRPPAPLPRQQTKSSARNDLSRIEGTGKAWWAHLPEVVALCSTLAVAPVRLLAVVADTAVSLCFLAVFGAIGLWWTGYIPDTVVATLLGQIGDRALGILEGSGLL